MVSTQDPSLFRFSALQLPNRNRCGDFGWHLEPSLQTAFYRYRLNSSRFHCRFATIEVERDSKLHKLAETLRPLLTTSQLSSLQFSTLSSIKTKGRKGRQFDQELQSFLAKYGYVWADRYPRDPAWKLNEESMIVSLKSLAMPVKHNSLLERNHDLKKTRRQVTEDAVQRLSPFCRLPFLWLVRKATSLFPFKDDRNHYVYAGVMSIREYGLEIGRRLKAHDLLESKADVFLLEWEELRTLLTDIIRGDHSLSVRETVAKTKQIHRGRR